MNFLVSHMESDALGGAKVYTAWAKERVLNPEIEVSMNRNIILNQITQQATVARIMNRKWKIQQCSMNCMLCFYSLNVLLSHPFCCHIMV